MRSLFQITEDQVERLDAHQLTYLLKKLLLYEAEYNGIPRSSISVSLNITSPDGGEDGRIKWEGNPERTEWVPNRYTCFQVKAKSLNSSDYSKELINRQADDLKPKICEVFNNNGQYIVFQNQRKLNSHEVDRIVDRMRETIRNIGKDYWDTCLIDIYDIGKITAWINSYPNAVRYVQTEFLEIDSGAFYSWESWSRLVEQDFSNKFIKNPGLEAVMSQITGILLSTGSKQRLIGLPGLGKTRIVFEIIKSSEELKGKMTYSNVNDSSENVILSGVRSIVENGYKCVLIIDNCNLKFHMRILKEIDRSGISLLSINSDMSLVSEEPTPLILDPNKFIDIIPELLVELFPELQSNVIERITKFSMGFPLIAILLAKDRSTGLNTGGRLNNSDLVDRLLGTDSFQDKDFRKVITACSIFDKIGFLEDMSFQRLAISKNSHITRLDCSEDIAEVKFYEVCQKYLEIGILEKAGRFLIVRPKPLALRLAEDWWKTCPPEKIQPILDFLESIGLAEALCDQIAKLDFLPEAKDITADLCGESGPFGKAEVLNSQQGSRLFRSLVEVNPDVTVDTLYNIYFGKSTKELKEVVEGRRNLVWALEKLCFRGETFLRASKVLLAFAEAENEEMIANNATGQLLQLFQCHLPGTQATLDERQRLIDFMLSQNKFRSLGISCLGKSLQTHHFTRMGGAETQGSSSILLDYSPTYKETMNYWEESISKLQAILVNDPKNRERAKVILISSLRGILDHGGLSIIYPAITNILEIIPDSKLDIYSEVKKILSYNRNRLRKEDEEKLNGLIEIVKPTNFLERYIKIVSTPDYENVKSGNYQDYINSEARKLALEFVDSNLMWDDYCKDFLLGDQQTGYIFGNEIGKQLLNKRPTELESVISHSLEVLSDMSKNERNANVLKGIISAVSDEEHRERVINSILKNPKLNYLFINIISGIEPSLKEIYKVFELVDNGDIQVTDLAEFKYGRILSHLNAIEIIELCSKINGYGKQGIWTSLSLLFMYCYRDSERFMKCKSIIKRTLSYEGILIIETRIDSMDAYYWESFSELILKEDDHEFASQITTEIIRYCKSDSIRNLDIQLRNIIRILVENYFIQFWSLISEIIIGDPMNFYKLRFIIGSRIGSVGEETGILFRGDLDTIFNWCKDNKPLGPVRIISIAPIYEKDATTVRWHPFTKRLIDEFGDIEDFIIELNSNFGSYIWTGSLVPLIEMKLILCGYLVNHPKTLTSNWAKNRIERLKLDLKNEKYEDEERQLY